MSKRGMSRASMRVRLTVAAAILVGGGAAGVVAASASHGGAAAAESAGFSTGRTMSYTSAMSSAVKGWSMSPSTSLRTISHMKPLANSWTQSWHRHILVIQRGTVVAVGRGAFAVQSANGTIKVWHVTRKTRTENVGGTSNGMSAMTGGTMRVPSSWNMNTTVKGIATGDRVFVFGERERHTLKAQLVLFAAPTMTMPTATPTATTPMGTPTATTPMGTPTATTPMGTPTATATTTAPAVKPTSTPPTFSGHHS